MHTGSYDGSATLLEEFFNDGVSPQDASDDRAAGAPPAEPPPVPDANPIAPDGDTTTRTEPSAAIVPAADPIAGVPSPDSTALDPDPLATATPLTYTVNDQQRTFEDIKVLPGHGAIVPMEAVPKLQQRLSERDHLYETSQQAYQQTQALERLTAWNVKGPDGQDRTLTGREALEARSISHARTAAALETLSAVLQDPAQFASLVTVNEQGQIVPDAVALQHLITRSELAEVNAERMVQRHYATLAQAVQQSVQQEQSAAQMPGQLWASAEQAWVSQFPQLTPEDKTFLAAQVPRYTRSATTEEVRAGKFTQGEAVLDPDFYALIQHQAGLRASAAKGIVAAQTAAQENAARLAGVITRPATPSSTPAKPSTTPAQPPTRSQRELDAQNSFAMMESLAGGRFPTSASAE